MDNEQNNLNIEFGNNKELPIKGKSKKKRIIIIAATIVVCISALSGGAYAYINSKPEVKVIKGIEATAQELKNNKGIIENCVGEDYIKILDDKGLNENMKFSIKSTNIPNAAELKNLGFSLDYSYDEKNKKLLADFGGQFNGTNVTNAKFYTDNNKLMLSVPQIYDAWFTCDTENIEKQYNSSILSQNQKMPTKKAINIKVFDDEKVLDGKELADAIIKGYLKENAEKIATVGKNIKVEKSKQTKNVEIDGTNQECTGYDVTISGQDAKDLVNSFADYLLSDQELKKYIAKQVKFAYIPDDQPYNSQEEMVEGIYKEFKDGVEEFKKSFDYDDIKAVIYLDKKGRAVSMDINTALGKKGEKVEIKCSGDLKGKDNLGNIMDMSIEFNENGKKFKVNLDTNTTTKDDQINQEINLVFDDNIQPVNVKGKAGYNTKSGDFDASIDMNAKGEGVKASFVGNSKFDKSSNKLDLNFDKIDIQSNMKRSKMNISLDGSCSISPLENPIEEPSGEKLELFKLDENKFMEIAQEVQKNATKMAGTFGKL